MPYFFQRSRKDKKKKKITRDFERSNGPFYRLIFKFSVATLVNDDLFLLHPELALTYRASKFLPASFPQKTRSQAAAWWFTTGSSGELVHRNFMLLYENIWFQNYYSRASPVSSTRGPVKMSNHVQKLLALTP